MVLDRPPRTEYIALALAAAIALVAHDREDELDG